LGVPDRLQKELELTDIFREVEEEVRRERLEKLWKQYGDYVIAGVAVVVIAVSGFILWQRYQENRRQQASAQYDAAVQLAAANPAAAIEKFEYLSKNAPSGYATLARFAEADTYLVMGNNDKAIAIFESLANGNNDLIGNAARLRAAWAIVETAPRKTVADLVAPLNDPASSWRFMAREVLAYADYRSGSFAAAQQEYESIANDAGAAAGVRARARGMSALIKAGGERNFGVVPPSPAAAPGQPPPQTP
jgi:hypothetical protein